MNKLFATALLAVFALSASALELTAEYTIVSSSKSDAVQYSAIKLLKEKLQTVLGKSLKVVAENAWDRTGKAIFIGDTNYARSNGVDSSDFTENSSVIKACDGNIIIAGTPKGLHYAVIELLELAGCRVLALDCEYIPRKKSVNIDDKFCKNIHSPISMRHMYIGRHNQALYRWNRLNGEATGNVMVKQIGGAHSFAMLSKDFPADKPELFALLKNGKRPRDASGQLCLTNPETRRLIKNKLSKLIAAEAETADPAKFYRVTPNDNPYSCQCLNCREQVEKYGAESGLLLEFINDIATAFPNVNIITFAYRHNRQTPLPGTIKLRNNIYVEVALQSIEWGDGEKRFVLQPWASPVNAAARKQFLQWKELTNNIIVWDYHRLYKNNQCLPYTAIPAIIKNMPFYAKNSVKGYFSENEMGSWRGGAISNHAFQELEFYLLCKLMYEPLADSSKIIDEYFNIYYGKAAIAMRKYYNLLIEAQTANPVDETKHFSEWKHLDKEFFQKAYKFIEEAKFAAGNNEELQKRIAFEVIPLNSALLTLWRQFQAAGVKFSFDRQAVEKSLKNASDITVERYFPNSRKGEEMRLSSLLTTQNKIKMPAGVDADTVRLLNVGSGKLLADSEALSGKSWQLGSNIKHNQQPLFGVYDPEVRKYHIKFRIKDIPQDEKFHYYYIGRCSLPDGRSYVFCHWSWRMIFHIGRVFSQDLINQPLDIYVYAKLQGPSYVKNSGNPDCFAVEHILIVPNKKAPPKIGLVE